MIKSILTEKYGQEMINNIMTNGQIDLQLVAKKGTQTRSVEGQMQAMLKLGILSEEDFEHGKPWAFDISSTYANIEKVDSIPIMVIGEDPHVQNNDYQAVYGFASWGPEFTKAQINDKDHFKQFLMQLFHSKGELNEMTDDQMLQFLSKFYVTDLCHFTPQGNNNRKHELANWKSIKHKAAQEFLKKEIETVKPRLIITHGGASRKFTGRLLRTKIPAKTQIGYRCYAGEYASIPVIGVTHLGSGQTLGHWRKQIDETREKFIKKYLSDIF